MTILGLQQRQEYSSGEVRAARLLEYLDRIGEVEGWCDPTTALAMAELIWQQEKDGTSGGVAEIGVHHGKSFLPLVLAAAPCDPLMAFDLFEMQDQNVDGSGCGNRDAFIGNLARFAPGRDVKVFAANSLDLWGMREQAGLHDLRFLSIDGGHTHDITLNDLRLADATLNHDGLCVLDDILNAHWTGVISGTFAFLASTPGLVPCGLSPNKLVLCRADRQEYWRSVLRVMLGHALEQRDREFGGFTIDIFGSLPTAQLRGFESHARIHALEAEVKKLREKLSAAIDSRDLESTARNKAVFEVETLHASTSWRLTAPMRRMKRWMG